MADNEVGPEGFGHTVMEKATLFYVFDSLLRPTNTVWLQCLFDTMISLFKWVGLQKNIEKTVTMVCQPGTIAGRQSTTSYGRRMNGKGYSHQLKQRCRVICTECGADLAASSLAANMVT